MSAMNVVDSVVVDSAPWRGRLDDEKAADFFVDAVTRWGRPAALDRAAHSEIVELCRELDGWPIALELAARRTTVQSVPELCAALRSASLTAVLDGTAGRTGYPTGGSIRGAVSHSLAGLRDSERRLAAELARFVDWATFAELADGMLAAVRIESLTALVDHGVVDIDERHDETLFRLRRPHREVLAEVARPERSSTQAEAAEAARHASLDAQAMRVIVALIGFSSSEQDETGWYDIVRRRHTDLSAAAWTLLDRADPASARAGAHIALALAILAAETGDLAAEAHLLDRALERCATAEEPRTVVLLEAYRLRRRFEAVDPTTDVEQLAVDLRAAVSAAKELGDDSVVLECLAQSVGSARTIGHLDQARRHADEGVDIASRTGRQFAHTQFELLAAMIAHRQRRLAESADRATRAYILARRFDQPLLLAQAALIFHQLPPGSPHIPRHRPSVRDLARIVDDLPARRVTLGVTNGVAAECVRLGDLETAARTAAVGIRKAAVIGLPAGAAVGIMVIAVTAAASGEHAQAARLHGALSDHLQVLRHALSPGHQATYDTALGGVRLVLGERAFAQACDQGASWTWTETIHAALATAAACSPPPDAADTAPNRLLTAPDDPPDSVLTARQLEVLRLLAAGMSNKEIAVQLRMSTKTTMHHASNIYRRLGVRGRGEAVAIARQLGIA